MVITAEVLIPLIQKYVETTTIHTDCWRAYNCLGNFGYIHKKINHSDQEAPFIAPDGTHTHRIESQWRVVKRYFQDNYNQENVTNAIIEYVWRREANKLRKIKINFFIPPYALHYREKLMLVCKTEIYVLS